MKLEFVVDEGASDLEIASAFVEWLEGMGARFTWRDAAQHDWYLSLDAVAGLTHREAETLAHEAFDHQGEIRDVLRARQRLTSGVIH